MPASWRCNPTACSALPGATELPQSPEQEVAEPGEAPREDGLVEAEAVLGVANSPQNDRGGDRNPVTPAVCVRSGLHSPLSRVEGVAETVTDEVDRQ